LFRDCTDRQLAEIDGLMTEITVPAGTTIVHEGQRGLEFFIIRDGRADVCMRNEVVDVLGRGGYFGEAALVDRALHTASLKAATDVRVWVLNRREFVALLEHIQPSYTTTPRTFLPAARSAKASLIPSSG